MHKIAAAEVDSLLIKSAALIRSQQAEIEQLRAQIATHDRHQHAEKIASIAVDRGLMSEDSAAEYAQELAQSPRDLGMVQDFVSRSNGVGVSLGEADTLQKTASVSGGSQADQAFAEFLLTSDLA